MTSTVMDLASGSLGGIAGTIVGHPFDTVKGNSNTNWIIQDFPNMAFPNQDNPFAPLNGLLPLF